MRQLVLIIHRKNIYFRYKISNKEAPKDADFQMSPLCIRQAAGKGLKINDLSTASEVASFIPDIKSATIDNICNFYCFS